MSAAARPRGEFAGRGGYWVIASYFLETGSGGECENVPRDRWPALLDEAEADAEHGAVMVSLPRRLAVEVDFCANAPRVMLGGPEVHAELGLGGFYYMKGVSRDEILTLWGLLAEDRIEEIGSRPWIAVDKRG